jgi:hypothetical protein
MKFNKSRVIIIFLIIVAVLYIVTSAEFRCIFADNFGFKKVDSNIFVQNHVSPEEVQIILSTVEKSKLRVVNFFGSMESNPIIVLGKDSNQLKNFGLDNHTASTRRDIFGTFIVIGENGLNEDVIAHELFHSEFGKRIGWYRLFQIPVWFDEGLAVQFDYRPAYSEEVWVQKTQNGQIVSALDTLMTANQFYTGDQRLHYTLAKHEVMEWLKKVGQKGLLELIDKIKSGEDFDKAYDQILKAD